MDRSFHISLPCRHIAATRDFYVNILEAKVGRSTRNWVDIDLFGNQLTFAKAGNFKFDYPNYSFEKTVLPSFHFGIILEKPVWRKIQKKIQNDGTFHIPETTFLSNKVGEHTSFFIKDPNGYVIEFKCFSEEEDTFHTS
ncbi:VOC family protein [Aureitalea sp. L0-47]|uniref:VOC family protein n=1 Tax=Aureitalea sp. L0-47 TaxID=2816962 RepID=UPI00223848C8|nr:VOC family protein [Aureitalea sp. L0-47]MCW5518643.1 VOC family protein [Aureitalea sp. L0-47]